MMGLFKAPTPEQITSRKRIIILRYRLITKRRSNSIREETPPRGPTCTKSKSRSRMTAAQANLRRRKKMMMIASVKIKMNNQA